MKVTKSQSHKVTSSLFKKPIIQYFTVYCLLSTVLLCGCDAFVRKFTRKKNKDKEEEVELVLAPQEYKAPQISKEDLYHQYFLFWKSWQGELIETLNSGSNQINNHKKQVSTIKESISNLQELRKLLQGEAQKKLDVYIEKMKNLQTLIVDDPYGSNLTSSRLKAEDLRSSILRKFSYRKVKDSLR